VTTKADKARIYDDIKDEFEGALRLRDAGQLAKAKEILLDLNHRYPDLPPVLGVLGDMQEELGELEEAARSYRRTTELSPGSELASISLFHALYQLGDVDGAFDEMRRFRSRGGPSEEYDRLVNDLSRNLRDGE
jgi:predicted Zn-dependent protease